MILIVDDDSDIRAVFMEILVEEGYPVVSAANGLEALTYLQEHAELPWLILLDLTMPVMSGWTFRMNQCADARLKSVPVIIISADGQLPEKVEQIGIDHYLQKPIMIDQLLEAVAPYVPSQRSSVQLAA